MPIILVDYGVGNIGALLNILEYIGVEAVATGVPSEIAAAKKLILPGVGAFDTAMGNLRSRRLIEPLNVAVQERKVPVLGICLGMQLLGDDSQEGVEKGLGWIKGSVVRIHPNGADLKVPHIGWANIMPVRASALFPRSSAPERFYFVHSYHLACREPASVAATIRYGDVLRWLFSGCGC